MLKDITLDKIKIEKRLSDYFLNASYENLSLNCNILKGNFFSDSFYYFPITTNNETFSNLYLREFNNISHFYSKKFYNNFIENKNSLKILKIYIFLVLMQVITTIQIYYNFYLEYFLMKNI